MKIHIYVNEVTGGWLPDDIDRFLGGGEEVVVLLAEAFVRQGYSVNVYLNFPGNGPFLPEDICKERNGVLYTTREKASFGKDPENEILITFKDPTPHIQGASVFRNIHFSSDVERSWPLGSLNYFVHLSNYHESRNVFIPFNKSVVSPLGIDMKSLDSNKTDKLPGTMLYCSSPDRGLVQLVQDWEKIRKSHPGLELKVAYGFKNFEAHEGSQAGAWKRNLLKMMEDRGIEYLGQLTKNEIEEEYWKAEYWCLPLQKPDSEMFCLNALKARYCGCMPVVNKMGALRDTVGDYIQYHDFVVGGLGVCVEPARYQPTTWDEVVKDYWLPLFRGVVV